MFVCTEHETDQKRTGADGVREADDDDDSCFVEEERAASAPKPIPTSQEDVWKEVRRAEVFEVAFVLVKQSSAYTFSLVVVRR